MGIRLFSSKRGNKRIRVERGFPRERSFIIKLSCRGENLAGFVIKQIKRMGRRGEAKEKIHHDGILRCPFDKLRIAARDRLRNTKGILKGGYS
jgi:hypothetical protein